MAHPKKLIDINLEEVTDMEWEQLLGKIEQRVEDINKEPETEPSSGSDIGVDTLIKHARSAITGLHNFYAQHHQYIWDSIPLDDEDEEDDE